MSSAVSPSHFLFVHMLAVGLVALFLSTADAAACPVSGMSASAGRCPGRRQLTTDAAGLLNEGKGCWGHCGLTAGDCDYCGTGQCCRKTDYNNDVAGCELASEVIGARCGLFRGERQQVLKNEGAACWGHCNRTAGDCPGYCGTGQCCRRVDGERCVVGCELAAAFPEGPAAQCGNFSSMEENCVPTSTTAPAGPTGSPTGSPTAGGEATPATLTATGLRNAGQSCWAACDRVDVSELGVDAWGVLQTAADCPDFCGTGQCCQQIDWYYGVPGCELAENLTQAVCGHYRREHPEPADFRLPKPLGTVEVSQSPLNSSIANSSEATWIRDIVAQRDRPEDHDAPAYTGGGGKPWSRFEMALVRDLILYEVRRATGSRDWVSAARMLRLAFHDCLRYKGGGGGCDGCLNWAGVGNDFEGRVEDREHEDYERKPSNNGLEETVMFLEYLYTLDLGKSWGSGCWETPATITGGDWVGDTQQNPIQVTSTEECQQHCINTSGCVYFTVPQLTFIDSRGPCRLFGAGGSKRLLPQGRLIAGQANCTDPSWSLKSRGKSRADLWVFAAIVAVEEGIDRHNLACDGNRQPYGGQITCTQFEGEEGCKIIPSRPLVFKTGRSDCVTTLDPPYKAEEEEVQKLAMPDEHFNGTMTVRFMEEHFGFSGRETVAIMGAHSMGSFHQEETGHKYVWTSDFQVLNNQFYRNIAGRPDWFFDDDECTKVGDAWGNKGDAVWIAKMNQAYRTGAPVQWIQKKVVCPNCAAKSYERGGRHPDRLAQDRDCCLNGVPNVTGAQCRPDLGRGPGDLGSRAADRDGDFSDGCEYSHFIFGNDETALSSDMGLMYKFDVDIRGFPSGCPGLATFFPSSNRWSDYTCGIDGRPWFEDPSLAFDNPNITRVTVNNWTARACPADCPKQDYTYPGETATLAEHVERFADDQDAWIEEFLPTMEKMIANGYAEGELVASWPVTNSEDSTVGLTTVEVEMGSG